MTIVGCLIGLAVLWRLSWLIAPNQWKSRLAKEEAFTTLLQVVPATIVAVFVFAVGAVFIIVQIIGPTLGSRAIEALLVRRRARACVIAGVILLLACLVLTALALIRQKGPPESLEASAGSALALASFIYVPLSILCISSVFHGFVSPGPYSRLLSRWGVLWRGPVAADWAFHQVRALRQWLRTACGTGESRDIVFALEGFQNLLGRYCDKARSGKKKTLNKKLREKNSPSEYSRAGEIVNSRWRQLLDPNSVPPDKMPRKGWFGDEFGRALARCAEVGIQSGMLLRRDLDRLLVALGGATLQLADVEPKPGKTSRPLGEEAGFLLDRIAEIGMYAFPFQGNTYGDWFERPALVLASLEEKLEKVNAQVTGPPGQVHSLAGRCLAAWCLVNYTFQQSKDRASAKGEIPACGRDRLGEWARTRLQLWDEATKLATNPAMRPSWMPPDYDNPDSKERLEKFIGDVQVLVAAQPKPKNLELVGLDDWIIGASVPAEPTVAYSRGYTATAADAVATVRSTAAKPKGGAFLGQVVEADGYRGTTVTFRGEVQAKDVTKQAELGLHILTRDRSQGVQKKSKAITHSHDWKWYEVTAPIPAEAELIQFSLTLTGTGQVALRNVALTRTRWGWPAFSGQPI